MSLSQTSWEWMNLSPTSLPKINPQNELSVQILSKWLAFKSCLHILLAFTLTGWGIKKFLLPIEVTRRNLISKIFQKLNIIKTIPRGEIQNIFEHNITGGPFLCGEGCHDWICQTSHPWARFILTTSFNNLKIIIGHFSYRHDHHDHHHHHHHLMKFILMLVIIIVVQTRTVSLEGTSWKQLSRKILRMVSQSSW